MARLSAPASNASWPVDEAVSQRDQQQQMIGRATRSTSHPMQGSAADWAMLATTRSQQQQLDERRLSKSGRKVSAGENPTPSRRSSANIRIRFHNFRRHLFGALLASMARREPATNTSTTSTTSPVVVKSSGGGSNAKKLKPRADMSRRKQMIARDCCLYLSSFRGQVRQDSFEIADQLAFDSEPSSLGTQSALSKEDQLQASKYRQQFETVGQAMKASNILKPTPANLDTNATRQQSLASRLSHKSPKINQRSLATQHQQLHNNNNNHNSTPDSCKIVELLDQFASIRLTAGAWNRREESKCLRLERSWTEFVHLKGVDDQSPDSQVRATASCQNLELAGFGPTLKVQQDAIWELISTEQFYLRRLRVVIDLFLATLLYLQEHSFLTEVDAQKLVSNIEEVYEANHALWQDHLLPMLESSRATRSPLDPTTILNAFVQINDIFRPYYRYCLEHSACLSYLKEQTKTSANFRAYIDWCESQKGCDRLKLMDLLAKPTQRITRYTLLLKAIAKRSRDPNHLVSLEQMILHMDRFVLTVDLELCWRDERELLLATSQRIGAQDFGLADVYSDEIERLVRRHHVPLDLTKSIFQCKFNCQRRLFFDSSLSRSGNSALIGTGGCILHHLEPQQALAGGKHQQAHQTSSLFSHHHTMSPVSNGKGSADFEARKVLGQLKFRDTQLGSKVEVVLLVFTDHLLICRPVTSNNSGTGAGGSSARFHFDLGGSRWNLMAQTSSKSQQSTELTSSLTTISQTSLNACGSPNAIHSIQQQQQQHLQPTSLFASCEKRPRAGSHAPVAAAAGSRADHGELGGDIHCNSCQHVLASRALSLIPPSSVDLDCRLGRMQLLKNNDILQVAGNSNLSQQQSNLATSLRSSVSSLNANCDLPVAATHKGSHLCHCKSTSDLRLPAMQQPQQQKQRPTYQAASSNADKASQKQTRPQLRLIRSPYPLERLEMFELEDGRSVFCCLLNESQTIANSFVLYMPQSAQTAPAVSQSSNHHHNEAADGKLAHEETGVGRNWVEAIWGRRVPPLASRRRMTPARHLINIVREAQLHMKLVADFHSVPMASIFPPHHHFYYHLNNRQQQHQQQQQQQRSRQNSTKNDLKLTTSDDKDDKTSVKTTDSGANRQRWSLAGWSSFRHSFRGITKGRLKQSGEQETSSGGAGAGAGAGAGGSLERQGTPSSGSEQQSTNETCLTPADQQVQPQTQLNSSPVLRSLMHHYRSMLLHHQQLDKLLLTEQQCASHLDHLYSLWSPAGRKHPDPESWKHLSDIQQRQQQQQQQTTNTIARHDQDAEGTSYEGDLRTQQQNLLTPTRYRCTPISPGKQYIGGSLEPRRPTTRAVHLHRSSKALSNRITRSSGWNNSDELDPNRILGQVGHLQVSSSANNLLAQTSNASSCSDGLTRNGYAKTSLRSSRPHLSSLRGQKVIIMLSTSAENQQHATSISLDDDDKN